MQMLIARGKGQTNFMSEKPLYVNNCGFYRDLDSDITVAHPFGLFIMKQTEVENDLLF